MHVRSPRVCVIAHSVCAAALSLAALRPLSAQQPSAGFPERPTTDLTLRTFTDTEIAGLLRTLDDVFRVPASTPALAPDLQLWKFTRWLQTAALTPAQETEVIDHLHALSGAHPSAARLFAREADAIRQLTLGKVAPEIEGRDLEGVPFKLSDYRGQIVVLSFGGEWCGICRAEYPYQRFLSELYKDRPFALLGVNSDPDVDAARRAKANRGGSGRAWWDGFGDINTEGPIATSYGIYGWPTVYILDEAGVIRFVDLRQEDLLKAVRQLMGELVQKTLSTKTPSTR